MTNKSLTGVGINATKDVDLYTEDQLMMIESIPHGVHLVLGLAVSVIGCLGFAANATVLVIFSRSVERSFSLFFLFSTQS